MEVEWGQEGVEAPGLTHRRGQGRDSGLGLEEGKVASLGRGTWWRPGVQKPLDAALGEAPPKAALDMIPVTLVYLGSNPRKHWTRVVSEVEKRRKLT